MSSCNNIACLKGLSQIVPGTHTASENYYLSHNLTHCTGPGSNNVNWCYSMCYMNLERYKQYVKDCFHQSKESGIDAFVAEVECS